MALNRTWRPFSDLLSLFVDPCLSLSRAYLAISISLSIMYSVYVCVGVQSSESCENVWAVGP